MNKSLFSEFENILVSLKKRMKNDPKALQLLAKLDEMMNDLWAPLKQYLELGEKAKETLAKGLERPTPEDLAKRRQKAREVLEAMEEAKGQDKH